GRVLLCEQGEWKPVSVYTRADVRSDPNWRPSRDVLNRLRTDRRTCWRNPEQNDLEPSQSLYGVEVVVAAPILDRSGEVVGAVYGDCRSDNPTAPSSRITKVEAMLVELLASSVATGLARMKQEKAALEAEYRFGQFFTPELSR